MIYLLLFIYSLYFACLLDFALMLYLGKQNDFKNEQTNKQKINVNAIPDEGFLDIQT